jgi:Iron-containing redox enzyme
MNAYDRPLDILTPSRLCAASTREHIDQAIEHILASLPDPEQLSADERRGIMARYTAVLEGNFIYWMSGTYLSVRSPEAQSIITDNLREEVGDNHPGMLRRFALAAHAAPSEPDRLAVDRELQNVRAFVAQLSGLKMMLMMAFFEGFIARFMSYLADLATRQGSTEQEYTEVHGMCDIAHTQELFRAFEAETRVTADPPAPTTLFEGVEVLQTLIQTIIQPRPAVACQR